MNVKTKILLFCSIPIVSCVQAFGQWTEQNSGTTTKLNTIFFTNSNTGFAAGGDSLGIILKTVDGGNNWIISYNNNARFTSIFLPSVDTGYAICAISDTIVKTIDGGDTWNKQYSAGAYGGGYGFPSVYFTDNNIGYAPGFKTIDGGNSWFSQAPSLNFFPYFPTDIFFINDTTGFVVGYEYWGAIFKTTNGGDTWTATTVPNDTWEIYSVHFPTETVGYATGLKNNAGIFSEIIKTTDGGNNWFTVDTFSSITFLSIHCTDTNTCYAVGYNGEIVKTIDGGNNWSYQNSGTTDALYDVSFTNPDTGFIVGANGTILKTTNGGGVTRVNDINLKLQKITVYPNPFRIYTLIEFENLRKEKHTLTLYNSIGQLVRQIDNITTGQIRIERDNLTNGLYFFQLRTDSKIIENKKFIIE